MTSLVQYFSEDTMPKKTDWTPGHTGTPPWNGKETMRNRLVVVLTEADFKRLTAAAKSAGKSKSTWARDILLAAAKADK
jgi:hypothetical protein